MSKLSLEPTSRALRHRVLREATGVAGRTVDAALEAFMLRLLLRFTRRPELLCTIIARKYLDSLQQTGRAREMRLRDAGDQWLLLSGLFSGLARRRQFSPAYFVDLGRGVHAELWRAAWGIRPRQFAGTPAGSFP